MKEQRRKRIREVKLSSRSWAPTQTTPAYFFLARETNAPTGCSVLAIFSFPPVVFSCLPLLSSSQRGNAPLGRGDRGRFAATPERSPSQSHILRLFKVFCNP